MQRIIFTGNLPEFQTFSLFWFVNNFRSKHVHKLTDLCKVHKGRKKFCLSKYQSTKFSFISLTIQVHSANCDSAGILGSDLRQILAQWNVDKRCRFELCLLLNQKKNKKWTVKMTFQEYRKGHGWLYGIIFVDHSLPH